MPTTTIGNQKTPGRPIDIVFGAELGVPSDAQNLVLIGHMGATGGPASGGTASGTSVPYSVFQVSNAGDPVAGKTEAETKFGVGSELAKMVVAAIKANAGGAVFPPIFCVPLKTSDTDFGPSDAALGILLKQRSECVVSCYDGDDDTLGDKLVQSMLTISAAGRVDNNQFGSYGVVYNRSVVDPADLHVYDTQYIVPIWQRDTGTGDDENAYSVAEAAAAAGASLAAEITPFNPVDDLVINSLPAPAQQSDMISVGGQAESETALNKGWTPLYTLPNGNVAFVRSVTARITSDGETTVTAYYDVQDFMVLYFWRKTLKTRFSQPDFKRRKASIETASLAQSEMVRLAKLFEANGMFQAVDKLAPQFIVERSESDRHRLNYFTPVNVIPGLHVMAGDVTATTQFDVLSI